MVHSTGTYGGFISVLDVNITENANNWTLFQYFPCETGTTQLFRVSLFIILIFIQK